MMVTVDQRLKWARDRRAWTQVDLARESGVPVVTISRIENRRIARPRQSTVRKLAEALGVDPGWLLVGEGVEAFGQLAERDTRTPRQYPNLATGDEASSGM
jgi:transcriptional regulator with XRE-family HTH domain